MLKAKNDESTSHNDFGAELGKIDLAEKDLAQLIAEVQTLIKKCLAQGMSKTEILAGYKQGKATQVANAEAGYKNREARSIRLAFERALKGVAINKKV